MGSTPFRAFSCWPAGMRRAATAFACLWLAACAVETRNTQPARELAQAAQPPGSTYQGWRVFHDRCEPCHGPAATGTDRGPDLLPRVAAMGPRRFVNLVLTRYDWNLPRSEAGSENAAREALVEEIMRGRQGAVAMPAWQNEPAVNAHILDLYAYLSARSEDKLAPGRPAR